MSGLGSCALLSKHRVGGGTLGKGCVNSNSYKGIMLSGFIFFSNKLSEDGVQKKMSSLCMELMKLRNMRDAKEKV